jgi:1-acyl-sn-glycerol-3-phosphate acyltransferase
MTRVPVRVARGALSGLFFVAYGVFALPFALLLPIPIWPKKYVRAVLRALFRLFVFLARATRLFRVECSAEDREALRAFRGGVVVMNHVSLIDVVILIAHLGDSAGIAKAAAKRNFFLGAVVKSVFIPNDSGAEKAIEDSRRFLGRGVNVIIFPEGTRVPPDAPEHRLNRGAARLALAARARVLACHVEYDPPVLGKSQAWWDVGDRQIVVRLSCRGEFAADMENNYRNAVALTEKIRERILGP